MWTLPGCSGSPKHGPTRGTWFLVDPTAGYDWPDSRPHLEGAELWEGGVYWSVRSTKGEWRRNMNTPDSNLCTSLWQGQGNPLLPQELGSSGTHFDDASCQTLTLHHRRHGSQAVPLHQPARYPRGCGALSRWYDDSQTVVTATAHGSTPCIHHEADQEAEEKVPSILN